MPGANTPAADRIVGGRLRWLLHATARVAFAVALKHNLSCVSRTPDAPGRVIIYTDHLPCTPGRVVPLHQIEVAQEFIYICEMIVTGPPAETVSRLA